MKTIVRAVIAAALLASFAGPASAQLKQGPAAAPAQQEPAAPPQIALTDKQVQGFITATPEITKITEKLQGDPDPKTQAQMEAAVKKAGLASLDEYEAVSANIGMVMQGIDPQTKKFGDPKAMIQRQIADVQADKQMKPAEKKEAMEELNQALKDVQPIKNQGNIALVEKSYDKIAPLMQE